jgi:hypothetical protein
MSNTLVNHSERKHALCSASSAERWLNCPGSVAMSLQVPEPPPSVYALEGTQMHELCEKLLAPCLIKYNENKDRPNISPVYTKDFAEAVNYPPEMRDYADEFVDLIWTQVLVHQPKKVCLEEKVILDKPREMFGTADLFYGFNHKGKKVLAIYDIKYGKGKVVEADSPQLIFYALAVQATYHKVKFDEFWLYVFQPRAEHSEGALRRHILKQKEAVTWLDTFLDGATKALTMVNQPDNLELKAGEHCLFCAAKPVCKVHAEYLNNKAGLDFTDEPAVLVPAIINQRYEIKNFMSDEQISKLLTHRKEIEKFLSALVEYAINRAQEGDPISGWKVVEGRSIRKWNDSSTWVGTELQSLGISNPWDKKLRGIGSIERELKDLGNKKPSEMIEILITKTNPPKSLVPEDDPRPAIDASTIAGRDFDVIDAA